MDRDYCILSASATPTRVVGVSCAQAVFLPARSLSNASHQITRRYLPPQHLRILYIPNNVSAKTRRRDHSCQRLIALAVASSIQSVATASPGSSSWGEDSSRPSQKNCYRLVVLGSARVGKTSIVARFLNNKFEESYTPTIEDFHRKLYRIRGDVHQLDILDTSGNHPFPAMRRLSFLTGDVFLLVFSMDLRESFEEVIRLREQILETKQSAAVNSGGGRRRAPNLRVPMVIVGNKSDKEMTTVSAEEAKSYASTQGDSCCFVETSAKRNLHIDDVFYELFIAAGLPLEMAPDHHRRVNAQFGSPYTLPPSVPRNQTKKCTISIKRRLSDACGVVAPNVRRPSIRTDLMIMRTKTTHGVTPATGPNKTHPPQASKCIIQ